MSEVVQGRGDVDRQRQVLLLLQRPVPPDQGGQPGAVDVLEDDVGPLALELVAPPLAARLQAMRRRADDPEATREVPIQVNGKLRDRLVVPSDTAPAELERLALASPRITGILAGRAPDKVIAAGGCNLINIVVRDA